MFTTKKNRVMLHVLFSVLLLVAAVPCEAQWRNQVHSDEMSGDKMCITASMDTVPTQKMSFPYGDVDANLIYQVKPENRYSRVAIVFSDLNLSKGEYLSGGYRELDIRARFDAEEPEWYTVVQQDNSLFFDRDDTYDLLAKIKEGKTFLVEVPWYNEGGVLFRFSLNGSTRGVTTARTQCGYEG